MWGGRALQPVFMRSWTEALFKKPVASGRLYYCTTDGEFTERLIRWMTGVVRAPRPCSTSSAGRSNRASCRPVPLKDACDTCDYRIVCGPHEGVRGLA